MSLAASEAGHLMAASIGVQWTAFLDMGVAQDLFAAMGQQQEACTQALSLKASLSAAMKDGLAFKDAHYIEMLRAHARVRNLDSRQCTAIITLAAMMARVSSPKPE